MTTTNRTLGVLREKLDKASNGKRGRVLFHWIKALQEMQRAGLDMDIPIGKVVTALENYNPPIKKKE